MGVGPRRSNIRIQVLAGGITQAGQIERFDGMQHLFNDALRIGRLVVQGILARDYPLVQGVMLIYGFAFVAVNLTVDILYTFADPRVRYD